MVQKYTAPVRVFKYPFELVMAAYEKRFPTCHLIPVFVGSDKIYENTSDDGSIHVIERRCRIAVDAPYLLRKITGVDQVLFIQKNTLNRKKRVLRIEAKNESFSSHINIHELCHYRVCPDNENWTIFEQQASLEIKSFWGFEHMVEKLAVKHYSQNIKKGEEIIEYHINELAQEGITHLPRYDASSSQNNHSSGVGDDDDNDDDEEEDDDPDFINRSFNRTISLTEPIKQNHNGVMVANKDSDNKNEETKRSKTKFDFRSNSVEEKLQATKQKILSKCESLKKKSSFESNMNNNNNNANTGINKSSGNNSMPLS